MRAIVAHGPRDVRLEDLPEPAVAGGAVVRVEAAGVCAADRMIWHGDSPWRLEFPFVPGHEVVGTVTAIDPEAAARWRVAEGDRIVPEVMVPCGRCPLCRRDKPHLCRRGRHIGSSLPGGWAEQVWLPSGARVWPVPAGLDPAEAVFAEPLACAIHAVERASPSAGEAVAVIGIGAIGAAVVAYLASSGRAAEVVALVTSPERAALALALGASAAIDVTTADAVTTLQERFDDVGPDIVIECSGDTAAVTMALAAVAPGGRVVLYGVYRERGSVDWNELAEFKELEIRGGHLAPREFGTAIDALARRAVDARALVTASYALEDAAVALDEPRGGMRLKTILLPDAGTSVRVPEAGRQALA